MSIQKFPLSTLDSKLTLFAHLSRCNTCGPFTNKAKYAQVLAAGIVDSFQPRVVVREVRVQMPLLASCGQDQDETKVSSRQLARSALGRGAVRGTYL